MRRVSRTRSELTDLLVRPPWGGREREGGWAGLIVDPIAQIEELADLCTRGLLSREEFERQKAKVLES